MLTPYANIFTPSFVPTQEKHNTTITDTQFVSYCLRHILYQDMFKEMRHLEEAILRLDEFGIFKSGINSVKCALQPFVQGRYKRSDWELQQREGVCVYAVPCLGDSKKVRFAICTD